MKKALKRAWAFARSMRFGLILLLAIAALSLVGSLVMQGKDAAFYKAGYGAMAGPILALGLDRLYSRWYFALLFALLCLNLVGCTWARARSLPRRRKAMLEAAQSGAEILPMPDSAREKWLGSHGFRKRADGLYLRSGVGMLGSLVTHIGLLALLIAAACTFATETSRTIPILVGNQTVLEDGSAVRVGAFSTTNDEGRTEYASELTLIAADGTRRAERLTVNHPAKLGRYKLYQETYYLAAAVDIQTGLSEPAEQVVLDAPAFLTLDGVNGVSYMATYENAVADENGQAMPASAGTGRPMYLVSVVKDGENKTGLVDADETLEAGGVYFTFRAPAYYPGILVKETARWTLPLLYASFGALLLGLYLCFFARPVAAALRDGGVGLAGGKEVAETLEQWKDEMEETKC